LDRNLAYLGLVEILCGLLTGLGFGVEPTGRHNDGCFMAVFKVDAFRPEVALIDLGLPGMDGYEVARELRSRPETKAIRLVAVTGYGQADDRRRALAAGFDQHVTKPVDASMLDDLLGRPTLEPER
jgi:CheY-like chemotaxis protein